MQKKKSEKKRMITAAIGVILLVTMIVGILLCPIPGTGKTIYSQISQKKGGIIINGAAGNTAGNGITTQTSVKLYTGFGRSANEIQLAGVRVSIHNEYSHTDSKSVDFARETLSAMNGENGYFAYSNNLYHFSNKMNKIQLQNCYTTTSFPTEAYSCTDTTKNSYHTGSTNNYGITLPRLVSELKTWEGNEQQLEQVLRIGFGKTLESLQPGDRIIIEPLYPICFNDVDYYLTETEIAIFGGSIYGYDTKGWNGDTVGKANHWSWFISWTNGNFANAAYIPTTEKSVVNELPPVNQITVYGVASEDYKHGSLATFRTIIRGGYGVHVAYTDIRPNKVTFTVNEYFDIPYDTESKGVGIEENVLTYSDNYAVTPNTAIKIGDYVSSKFENWHDSNKGYEPPWNYSFDGSYAVGLTGKTTDINQKYLIGSDGITINVYYKPDDVNMTLTSYFNEYDASSHICKESSAIDKSSYYPMNVMDMIGKGYVRQPNEFSPNGSTPGSVGSPLYFLSKTKWMSDGFSKKWNGNWTHISKNQEWTGYEYPYNSAKNKFGFTMCKKENNINALYEANLTKYTIEYYVNDETSPRKTLENVYYQPEGWFYGVNKELKDVGSVENGVREITKNGITALKQDGENFFANKYFYTPEEFNENFASNISSNATIDHATIKRKNASESVNITESSNWTVTTDDNEAVIKIYYNEPVNLTVNHYVDGEYKFTDNKICKAGRTFADGYKADGEEININNNFEKGFAFWDNFGCYPFLKKAKIDTQPVNDDVVSDKKIIVKFKQSDVTVDLYYETAKMNVNVEYYLNENTTPFNVDNYQAKGYIEYKDKDKTYTQKGDNIVAENFIFSADILNGKYGEKLKEQCMDKSLVRPKTVVEAITYSYIDNNGELQTIVVTGEEETKKATHEIVNMNDVTVRVYYSEPVKVTYNHYADNQLLEEKTTTNYVKAKRNIPNIYTADGETYLVSSLSIAEKYEVKLIVEKVNVTTDSTSVSYSRYSTPALKHVESNKDITVDFYYRTEIKLKVLVYVMGDNGQYILRNNANAGTIPLTFRRNSSLTEIGGTVSNYGCYDGTWRDIIGYTAKNCSGYFSFKNVKVDNDKYKYGYGIGEGVYQENETVNETVRLGEATLNGRVLNLEGENENITISDPTDNNADVYKMHQANNTLCLYYDKPFKTVTLNYNYVTFDETNGDENTCTFPKLNWSENNKSINEEFSYHDYGEIITTNTKTIRVYEGGCNRKGEKLSPDLYIPSYKNESESLNSVFVKKFGEKKWTAISKYNIPIDTEDEYIKGIKYVGNEKKDITNSEISNEFNFNEMSNNTIYNFYFAPDSYKILFDKNSPTAEDKTVELTVNNETTLVNNMENAAENIGNKGFIKKDVPFKICKNSFFDTGIKFTGWTVQDINTGLWRGYHKNEDNELILGWYEKENLIKIENLTKEEIASIGNKITKDGCYLYSDEEEVSFDKSWGVLKFYAQWSETGAELKGDKLKVLFSLNSSPSDKNKTNTGYGAFNTAFVGSEKNNIDQYKDSVPMDAQFISRGEKNEKGIYENGFFTLKNSTFKREGYDFAGWVLELVKATDAKKSFDEQSNELSSNTYYDTTVGSVAFNESSTKNRTYFRQSNAKAENKGTTLRPNVQVTTTYKKMWALPSDCKNETANLIFPYISIPTPVDPYNPSYRYVVDNGGEVDKSVFYLIPEGESFDDYYIIAYAQWDKEKPKFTVVFQDEEGRPAWDENNKELVQVSYSCLDKDKTNAKRYETTYDCNSSHYTSFDFIKYSKAKNSKTTSNTSYRETIKFYNESINFSYYPNKDNCVNNITAKGEITSPRCRWQRYKATIEGGNKIIITLYADYNIKYDRNQGQGEDDIFDLYEKTNGNGGSTHHLISKVDISKNYNVLSYAEVTENNYGFDGGDDGFAPIWENQKRIAGCEMYRVYKDTRAKANRPNDFVEMSERKYLAYNVDKLDWYTEEEITNNNYQYYFIKSGNEFGPKTIENFSYLVKKGDIIYFEAQWQTKVNIKFTTETGAEPFMEDDKAWNSVLSVSSLSDEKEVFLSTTIKKAEDTYFSNAMEKNYNAEENYIANIILSNDNNAPDDNAKNYNVMSFLYNSATGASEYPDQLYGKELRLKGNERWSHYDISVKTNIVDEDEIREPDLVTVTLYDKYYNIEYDANGGRNTMQGQKATSGEQITLNKNLFERDNFSYRFWYASYQDGGNTYWYGYKGNATEPSWQLEKDLTRKYAFSDEEKVVFNFTNKVTVTMHAQWAANFTVEYVDENGNPAFDSWNNKVSYSCDENGTYKWLSTTTKSTSSYYPLDVINKDTTQTEMKVSAALGHSSAISSSYTDFIFKYKINEGVMKADNVQYDKIVLINQNGVSPIEAKKWNAYKLEIVDAHKVRITLLKVGYTIQYDCNGNNVNGSMSPQTAYPYEPIQLSKNAFTRDNFSYRFWYASRNVNNTTLWYGYSEAGNNSTLGWYSNNEIKQYYAFSDASIVRFNLYNETVTMHARWAAKFTVSYVDENGSPAFDSWYNTVTYRSKADGKSYWLTPLSTRSTTGYFTNEMFNKISEYTFTSRAIFYNYNTSSTANGYQQFVFDYNINNGVSKSAKIEYDKIIHFNESGISPIENQRWNAYKLEIPNEHEVKITLYKLDYEVIYDANGGTGNMSTDKALPNTDYTVKTNAFTKSETVKNQVLSSKFRYWYAEDENHNWYGYTTAGDKSTLGWYSSDKIKEYYKVAEGEKLNLNKWGGSVTLHAQWLTPFLIDYVDNNYQPLFTDEDPVFKYWCMAVRIKYKSSTEEKDHLAYTRRGDVVYMTSETDYPTSGRDGKITMKKNLINGIVVDNQTGKNMMALFLDNDWDSGLRSYVPVFFNYETNKGISKYSGQYYDKERALTGNKYFSHYKLEVVSPYHLRVVLTPKTFTVNYDGNGGLGKMDSDTTRFGIPYNAKENGFFKPYESNFRCWYLYDNDTKMWYGYSKYGDESTLGWYQGQDLKQYYEVKENEQLPLGNKIEGSVTLYAQWFTPFTVSYVKNQYNSETGEYEKVPAFDKWNNYVFGSGLHSDKGSAVNSSFNDTDKPYTKFPFSQEYFYGGTQHAGYFGKTLKYSARIGRNRDTSYAGYVTILPFYYNTNTGVAEDQNPAYQCQNCYFSGMRNNMKEVDGHYYCPKCNYQFADNFYDTIIKFGNRAPTGFYAYEMSILNQNEIEITLYTKDELVDHYDVHYDKNSDEALGTMKSSHHYFDEPFTLDKCAFTRNGYNFRGWAVRDDATGNYLCYDVNGNKVWASEGKQVIVEDQCENVNFPILDVPENNGSITFVAQWQAGFNVHFITQYGAKAFTSWNSAVRYEDNTYSSLSRSTSPDTRYFAANDNIAVGAKFESYVCFGNTPDAALSPASLDNLNVVRFNYDAENGISMSDKQKYDTKIPIENCEDWTAYSVSINEITGDIYITLYEPPRELSINYYQPNANYTCGTTVIATFKVTNNTKYNYNPDDGIATMTVTMTGENGTDTPYQYGTYTKDFVIPARKSQNVYFKIPIPLDTATEHIRITANITYEGVVIAEYDITTNDGNSGYTTTTTVVGKMKTPEYGYNTKVPTNYKYLTADEVPSKRLANAASWDEYVYIGNGKYEKKTYYSLMRLDAGSTRPNAYCPVWWFNNDKNSKLDKPNFYKLMRSGYGLDVFYSSGFYTSDRIARLTNGVPCTDTNAFVPAQVSKIYYPENNYGAFALSDEFFDIYANRAKSDVSKDVLYDTVFASHYWNRVSNDWVASTEITGDQFNTASRTYFAKIKHMTPMWVKDGDYAVQPVATDAWTPAGMLSAGNVIDTTGIEGSMYDDWRWVSGQTK